MPYCPKCGREISDDAKFCPYCRESIQTTNIFYRRTVDREEKDEKDEKDEKSEKDEKHEDSTSGSILGGLILLWLGVSFLLRQFGYISFSLWWSYFLIGLGVILFLNGIYSYSKTNSLRGSQGYFIGGIIVSLIGASTIIGLKNWWGLILIILALYIIFNGLVLRKKYPKP